MAYLPDLSYGPDTRIVLVGTTICPLDMEWLPPVPHAKHNIDYLSRLFTDPDICGLEESCIIRVLDRENASEITDQIARGAQEATDTLLVYYAGHGLYGDTENPLYLAAQKTTEKGKAFNGVPVTLVKKAMQSSPAHKRILILDCCYSGRALDGGLASANPEAAVQPAIDIEGTYGIAAVPAHAKALAPEGEKFTRFTGALVDVLEHGLPADDHVLTLEDVFAEVERKIGRKADAPLPKRVNWDKGQKFCIARNRSLHRRELNRLYEAVQGLRETMTATGARLQALEAKTAEFEGMSALLAEIQRALDGKTADISSKSKARAPIWSRLGIQESRWNRLPTNCKAAVLAGILGRRNGFMLVCVVACITSAAIYLILAGSNWAGALSLTVLDAIIGWVMLYPLFDKDVDFDLDSEAWTVATNNDYLVGFLARSIVDVSGAPVERSFIFAACLLAWSPLLVTIMNWISKFLPRILS